MMGFWKYLVYSRVLVNDEKLRRCFEGKWVVVTGASSGIGEALAHRLIDAKANLCLISRNEEKLMSLCEKAKKNGCEACYYAIDLRQREELDTLCVKLRDQFPAVSYLFCNAGKSIHRSISDSIDRMHDYDRCMDLNYRSMVALSLALMPALRQAKGRIVYTSSVSCRYPFAPGWSAYHASKCAAIAWWASSVWAKSQPTMPCATSPRRVPPSTNGIARWCCFSIVKANWKDTNRNIMAPCPSISSLASTLTKASADRLPRR